MIVKFHGPVGEALPKDLRDQVEGELKTIIAALDPTPDRLEALGPPPGGADQLAMADEPACPSIYVLRVFSGHTPEYRVKVVLGIEVTYPDRYERHIVKIGTRAKVAGDFEGWQECTRGKNVASRIFAPVRMFELGGTRVGVVYRDAFALFGPEIPERPESQPNLLEEAVAWAASDDKPDPISVERALAHVYTDLGLWFYWNATVEPEAAHHFYQGHLRRGTPGGVGGEVLGRWQADPARQKLRRQAVWVLAGRDMPDADPVAKPARYIDAVDYVRWAMSEESGGRLPDTLVGRSHGDLHARNVLVGIRRGEVQYPAVFDYGDMSGRNVLAWDFAKLETELKARLLPAAFQDEAVLTYLVKKSGMRTLPATPPTVGIPSENLARADRMAATLAFEELLDELSRKIVDEPAAERIAPFRTPPTPNAKVNRLLGMILRVRKEAALWLGFKHGREPSEWIDEHYFALGVYGLLNVRWRYTTPQQEAALVSSGVALARLSTTPARIQSAIKDGFSPGGQPSLSYRVPLAILHGHWKSKRHREGQSMGRAVALEVGDVIGVHPGAHHAVPLIGHALLLETEIGEFLRGVEPILNTFRGEAREFGDYEMLARIGRFFKESGDLKWEEAITATATPTPTPTAPQATRPPWFQMYDRAYGVYAEAFEATNDWYVGINAATLALLAGNHEVALLIARKVAKICVEHREHDHQDRYWLFATEGEAALILNEPAKEFYREALAELAPGQWGQADSTYKQACRLWKILGDRVVPILELFEKDPSKFPLTPHVLGRDFP